MASLSGAAASEGGGSGGGQQPLRFLFIGNPGVGKSTMCNGLARHLKGDPLEEHELFKAGLNIGKGLTRTVQTLTINGFEIIDTPGLFDLGSVTECAQEITKALRRGGAFKIFFMVKTLNCRILHQDAALLQTVMKSCPDLQGNNKFAIVLNQLSKGEINAFSASTGHMQLLAILKKQLNPQAADGFGPNFTQHIHFVLEDERLRGKDVALPADFINFMFHKAPAIDIHSDKVTAMDTRSAEDLIKIIDKQTSQMEKDKAAMDKQMRLMKERHQSEIKHIRESVSSGGDNCLKDALPFVKLFLGAFT